ncbi:hypothetical protein NKDENANG_03561 [Candidatus Entotheonellaceae bacterium PAL068K]
MLLVSLWHPDRGRIDTGRPSVNKIVQNYNDFENHFQDYFFLLPKVMVYQALVGAWLSAVYLLAGGIDEACLRALRAHHDSQGHREPGH